MKMELSNTIAWIDNNGYLERSNGIVIQLQCSGNNDVVMLLYQCFSIAISGAEVGERLGEIAVMGLVVLLLAYPENQLGVLAAESYHVLADCPTPAAGMPRGILNGVLLDVR